MFETTNQYQQPFFFKSDLILQPHMICLGDHGVARSKRIVKLRHHVDHFLAGQKLKQPIAERNPT
jgi:hypothetical protein